MTFNVSSLMSARKNRIAAVTAGAKAVLSILAVLSGLMIPKIGTACSCGPITLAGQYERSDSVFTAQITATEKEKGQSRFEAIRVHFAVGDRFKGDVPFEYMKTAGSGAMCGVGFSTGAKYLIFADDSGGVSLCSGTGVISETRPGYYRINAWTKILKDFQAGRSPDLSELWTFADTGEMCLLSNKFSSPGIVWPANIQITYRKVAATGSVSDEMPDLYRAGTWAVWISLPGNAEKKEAPVRVTILDSQYVLKYSDYSPGSVPGLNARQQGYHILTGADALSFVRKLTVADSVGFSSDLNTLGEIESVASTTHIDGGAEKLLSCAESAT